MAHHVLRERGKAQRGGAGGGVGEWPRDPPPPPRLPTRDGRSLGVEACHFTPAGLQVMSCGKDPCRDAFVPQIIKCPSMALDAGDVFTG